MLVANLMVRVVWNSSLLIMGVFNVECRIWKWREYDIRYQCAGDSGPAVVLIHGFGANW